MGFQKNAVRKIIGSLQNLEGHCVRMVWRSFAEQFVDQYGTEMWTAWTIGRTGKGRLDLRTVNEILLRRTGLTPDSIQHVGPCTSCGGADLASYRVQGADAGRQLSWIGLRAAS